MKEPNLDAMINFLVNIGNSNCDELTVDNIYETIKSSGKDFTREIEQLLYFCKAEQAATVENEICQIDDNEKKQFLKALVAFYPITKNVIVQMLRKADIKPADFLEVYDANRYMLKTISENISFINHNSTSNNVSVNQYISEIDTMSRQIDELEKNRTELEKSIEDYNGKKSKIDKLKKDIEKLVEIKNSGVDKEIERLENRKNQLREEKLENESRRKKLAGEIEKLKKEIDNPTDQQDEKCQEALNQLQKCIEKIVK